VAAHEHLQNIRVDRRRHGSERVRDIHQRTYR
jgi:hypothetical protein